MTISLQQLRIASPCTMSWNDMPGNHRARFCGECRLHVYNIESMTEHEIHGLIVETEGRFCGRLWVRKDGTIVTRDCPVGLAMLRRGWWWTLGKAAAALTLVGAGVAWALNQANPHHTTQPFRSVKPIDTVARWLRDQRPNMPVPGGIIYVPPAAPAPVPAQFTQPNNLSCPEDAGS